MEFGDIVFYNYFFDEFRSIGRFIYQRPDTKEYIVEEISFNKNTYELESDLRKLVVVNKIKPATKELLLFYYMDKIEYCIAQINNNTDKIYRYTEYINHINETISYINSQINILLNKPNKTPNQTRQIALFQKAIRRKLKKIKNITKKIHDIVLFNDNIKSQIENNKREYLTLSKYVMR